MTKDIVVHCAERVVEIAWWVVIIAVNVVVIFGRWMEDKINGTAG